MEQPYSMLLNPVKPRQGFIAIALCGVCVSVYLSVCLSVRLSVNNIAQKVFNQSNSYLVAAFPLTQG